MMRFNGVSTRMLFLLAITSLVMTGCAGTQVDTSSCVLGGAMEKSVASEAKLTEFSCVFKEWQGASVLHFTGRVRNVSDQPRRFRVNIFLDNGKAAGGLLPRKTGKGLLKPGKSVGFEYPVAGMSNKPRSIELFIRAIGP